MSDQTSIDDAVARAKAIAAKLAQTTAAVGSDGSASKRKRWATADNTESNASVTDANEYSKRFKEHEETNHGNTSKKVWIPTHTNPNYNFVGLLIGPGGSKQKALQAEAGGRVKIQVRGKGSHNKIPSSNPTDHEEPLHVLLEGDPACVDKAESLIKELLNDTEKADAEKTRQLAEMSGVAPKHLVDSVNKDDTSAGFDSSLAQVTGTNPVVATSAPSSTVSVSTYKPAPVAQLIGQAMAGQNSSIYGPAGSSTGDAAAGSAYANPQLASALSQQPLQEQMGIPNGVVGYIIGKGGESITSMQRRTSCRVQIQKEHEMAPGSTTRIITLIGQTPESIAQCRQIIEHMVAERERLNAQQQSYGGSSNNQNPAGPYNAQLAMQNALAAGLQLVPVQVPDADVGLIIGKGGVTIRSIQERSGANIQIPTVGDTDNPMVRTISVTHSTLEGANFAKQMVEEILRNKINFQSNHNGAAAPSPNDSNVQVLVSEMTHEVSFSYCLSPYMVCF